MNNNIFSIKSEENPLNKVLDTTEVKSKKSEIENFQQNIKEQLNCILLSNNETPLKNFIENSSIVTHQNEEQKIEKQVEVKFTSEELTPEIRDHIKKIFITLAKLNTLFSSLQQKTKEKEHQLDKLKKEHSLKASKLSNALNHSVEFLKKPITSSEILEVILQNYTKTGLYKALVSKFKTEEEEEMEKAIKTDFNKLKEKTIRDYINTCKEKEELEKSLKLIETQQEAAENIHQNQLFQENINEEINNLAKKIGVPLEETIETSSLENLLNLLSTPIVINYQIEIEEEKTKSITPPVKPSKSKRETREEQAKRAEEIKQFNKVLNQLLMYGLPAVIITLVAITYIAKTPPNTQNVQALQAASETLLKTEQELAKTQKNTVSQNNLKLAKMALNATQVLCSRKRLDELKSQAELKQLVSRYALYFTNKPGLQNTLLFNHGNVYKNERYDHINNRSQFFRSENFKEFLVYSQRTSSSTYTEIEGKYGEKYILLIDFDKKNRIYRAQLAETNTFNTKVPGMLLDFKVSAYFQEQNINGKITGKMKAFCFNLAGETIDLIDLDFPINTMDKKLLNPDNSTLDENICMEQILKISHALIQAENKNGLVQSSRFNPGDKLCYKALLAHNLLINNQENQASTKKEAVEMFLLATKSLAYINNKQAQTPQVLDELFDKEKRKSPADTLYIYQTKEGAKLSFESSPEAIGEKQALAISKDQVLIRLKTQHKTLYFLHQVATSSGHNTISIFEADYKNNTTHCTSIARFSTNGIHSSKCIVNVRPNTKHDSKIHLLRTEPSFQPVGRKMIKAIFPEKIALNLVNTYKLLDTTDQ